MIRYRYCVEYVCVCVRERESEIEGEKDRETESKPCRIWWYSLIGYKIWGGRTARSPSAFRAQQQPPPCKRWQAGTCVTCPLVIYSVCAEWHTGRARWGDKAARTFPRTSIPGSPLTVAYIIATERNTQEWFLNNLTRRVPGSAHWQWSRRRQLSGTNALLTNATILSQTSLGSVTKGKHGHRASSMKRVI